MTLFYSVERDHVSCDLVEGFLYSLASFSRHKVLADRVGDIVAQLRVLAPKLKLLFKLVDFDLCVCLNLVNLVHEH